MAESAENYPPTFIIVHRKESANKCTVLPLRGHPALKFFRFPFKHRPDTAGYVRLGLGGPLLGSEDAGSGLLVLDGNWQRVGAMEAVFDDLPIRSLPPWQTAYPRISQVHDDPPQGLATVEALYAALTILGRPTDGILDVYPWREAFLALNESRIF